jgi:hypothetical protein
MNPVVNIRQDVQPFGCVTLRPGWSSDGAKRLGVSGSATDAECAKFEITREGDFSRNGKKFRFKEL